MLARDWVRTTGFMVLSEVCREMASLLGGKRINSFHLDCYFHDNFGLGGSCGVLLLFRKEKCTKKISVAFLVGSRE